MTMMMVIPMIVDEKCVEEKRIRQSAKNCVSGRTQQEQSEEEEQTM